MTKRMVVRLEEITPQRAQQYLALNKKNRNLNNRVVDAYAAEMKAGRWDSTSTPITFFEDNTLADGQHRLSAIVRANVTVKMFVCRNAPFSGNYDNGMPRNVRDQIYLAKGQKYSTFAVSVANLAVRAKKKTNKFKPSTYEIEEWLKNSDMDVLNKIFIYAKGNREELNARQSAYVLAAYSYYKNNPTLETLEEVKEVLKVFKSGFMNEKRSSKAVIRFRNSALKNFSNYGISKANGADGQFFKLKLFQEVLRMYHNDIIGKKLTIDCPQDFIYSCA